MITLRILYIWLSNKASPDCPVPSFLKKVANNLNLFVKIKYFMQKDREVYNMKCANHYTRCSRDSGKVVFKAFTTLFSVEF